MQCTNLQKSFMELLNNYLLYNIFIISHKTLPDPAFKTDPVYSPNELLINENITEFAVILMPLS